MTNGFTLYVSDVLERPVFKMAALIAGGKGVTREVGWVHMLEITHVAPFVTKNDLILTTGLWLKQSEQDRLIYMQQLIHQEAAGLCVEFGTTIEQIPEEIIAMANQFDFPLIVFDHPVRFVEITQDIHALLINQQHQLLKDLEAFSRRLQQITLQSTDVQAILHLLYEYTGQQIVYHSAVELNKFHPRMSVIAEEQRVSFYKKQVENNENVVRETSYCAIDAHQVLLSQPVICLGQTLSYLGLIHLNHEGAIAIKGINEKLNRVISLSNIKTMYQQCGEKIQGLQQKN